MALTDSGNVFSWGYTGRSSLFGCGFFGVASPLGHGISDASTSKSPKQIENINNVQQIAAGSDFSIALANDGKLWGWGQLPRIYIESGSIPIELVDLNHFIESKHTGVKKISAVGSFAMILLENGRLFAIGRNNGGVFATRTNPRIITDNILKELTKINDEPLGG